MIRSVAFRVQGCLRTRALAVLVVLLALPFLRSPAAQAASIIYVDRANPNCSNSGTGTQTQPFCTISAAASKVKAGQTVSVSSGTYTETVVVGVTGTASAPIVFMANPPGSVTVTGGTYGFKMAGKSWITIQGFNVTQTSNVGIYASSSNHITIASNHVTFAGQPQDGYTKRGILLVDSTSSLVVGNTADHNSDAGIGVTGSSANNEVRANVTFANARGWTRAAPGIDIRADNNIVDNNVSYSNEDSGIQFYSGASNNVAFNNVLYNNGDHGIDVSSSPGQILVANTAYHNVTAGLNVEGPSGGTVLANNISVDNGINSPRTKGNIRVDATSSDSTTIDYDLVSLSTPGIMIVWGSTKYTSLSAMAAATGQESHGIQADPKFIGAASGNFHLSAGSPAIDSANSGAPGQPSTDAEGSPRADDPATPNTGVGPRGYDDRGAYEYQPPPDAPPIAALTVSPSSGTAPLDVTADASASTDTDQTPISSYSFDFGDGSAAVGPQASATAAHTYTAPGTYTVTVAVTDTGGKSSTATAQVQVNAPPPPDNPPLASLTVSPSSGAAPLDVTADASASTDTDLTPIAFYSFDFGDGSPAVGPQTNATAVHTYTAPGTYKVTVTVTDTGGKSSTATAQVQVT